MFKELNNSISDLHITIEKLKKDNKYLEVERINKK